MVSGVSLPQVPSLTSPRPGARSYVKARGRYSTTQRILARQLTEKYRRVLAVEGLCDRDALCAVMTAAPSDAWEARSGWATVRFHGASVPSGWEPALILSGRA